MIRLVFGAALVAGVGAAGRLEAQQGAAPGTPAAADAKGKRTAQDVIKDLNAYSAELRAVNPTAQSFFDAERRKELAPKAIPPMKKMVGAFEELMQVEPAAKPQAAPARYQFLAMLSLLGDEESVGKLAKLAESGDKSEAGPAKATQLLVRWWRSPKDAPAQEKVLEEMRAVAKDHADSDELTTIVMMMSQQGAATPGLRQAAQKILLDDLKSDMAKEMAEQVRSEQKLQGLEGKPLVIEGVKSDGTKVSTADWKGKVILVDFWATWCGPCIAELPRVKKTYVDYHDKGLEILGVSCDNGAEDLAKFLEKNKDMPWPQLFDKSKPGWHALATEYGINGIPTMFLIDKKGVVRTVRARENFEEMIPKLLEEEG